MLYDLFGIVNHYGSMGGGHYIAHVKNDITQEWIRYDDSKVTVIPESQVRSNSAYVLFYRKRELRGQEMNSVIPLMN